MEIKQVFCNRKSWLKKKKNHENKRAVYKIDGKKAKGWKVAYSIVLNGNPKVVERKNSLTWEYEEI